MINSPPNLQNVIDQLISEEYLPPDEPPKIVETLAASASEIGTPWYIRGLIGISGWFSAIFFIAFLFIAEVITTEIGAIVVGAIFCAVAVGLKQALTKYTFVGQLTLAMSLAGQLLFIGGIASEINNVPLTILITILLEGTLIALYPDKLHRFLSSLVIWGAIFYLFLDLNIEEVTHFYVILLAVGTVLIWENEVYFSTTEFAQLYRPIGYSLPIAMFGILIFSLVDELDISWWWISAGGLLLVLLYLEYLVFTYHRLSLRHNLVLWLLGGTVILIIPSIQTPGILAAIIVLMLGFHRSNRLLMGLATAFLALFLIGYYYNLEITLLAKSFVLMGTGLVLFTLRYFLWRNRRKSEVSE